MTRSQTPGHPSGEIQMGLETQTRMRVVTASPFMTDENWGQLGSSSNGRMSYSVHPMGRDAATPRDHPPTRAHAAAWRAPQRSAFRGESSPRRVRTALFRSHDVLQMANARGWTGGGGRRQREVPAVWNRALRDHAGVGIGHDTALPFAGRLHGAGGRDRAALLPVMRATLRRSPSRNVI